MALVDSSNSVGLIQERLRSVVMVQLPDGLGSGFYVTATGLLVTSAHVVGDRTSVTIRRFDRSTAKASVVRVASGYDLALLWDRSDTVPPPIPLASSTSAAAGMICYAIGHPAGLDFTVTRGIVSSIKRVVSDVHYIQTDAAAHPGSSGGPVLDSSGDVLGVSTFGLKADGLSFALSVRYVRELLGEVVLPAKVESTQKCASCGTRNKMSRRACRRCSAPFGPPPAKSPLADLFAALDPPAVLQPGAVDAETTVSWRGQTYTVREHAGELHISISFAAVGSGSIALRTPLDAAKLVAGLEALDSTRSRLNPTEP